MHALRLVVLSACVAALPMIAHAEPAQKWVTAWAASVQGPYPVGNPSAQPDLRFALPSAEIGARDQTFRLIVRPDVWGHQVKLRFSNALGTRPVRFDAVYVGLQLSGAALFAGSNRPVGFGGQRAVTVAPGQSVWSDPLTLPFASGNLAALDGRKLAVSFHVAGESGPMTWHAKALTTSYLTAPGLGALGAAEDESAFPYSTASWFFLDALDVMAPADTRVVVAFGDSITDGTASTMNGDDRWPDVLSRRLHAAAGAKIAVINAGIGGNQVIGPAHYAPDAPFPGGPAAVQRLERDVLSLSGISAVIWLEGINDFSKNGNATVEAVEAGLREAVGRLRAAIPGVRVIGATVISALGSTSPAHGFPEQDAKRKALNDFIRSGGLFDGVADFDRATLDPTTGGLRAEFVPESTTGGPGDKLHPNRAGYLAMGQAIDLDMVLPENRNVRR
jgi:lysophospholipase L1-like esterase